MKNPAITVAFFLPRSSTALIFSSAVLVTSCVDDPARKTTTGTDLDQISNVSAAVRKDSPETINLKRRIYDEYPELRDESVSDFERVTRLRQWAWGHTDTPGGLSNKYDYKEIDLHNLTAPEFFRLFEQDCCGVFCGGTAVGLTRLYELFGYRAWTLGIGERSSASHTITLVEIKVDDRRVMCLQDAHFNTTCIDTKTGKPLDYFEILRRLREGNHTSIKTLESDYKKIETWPDVIIAKEDMRGRNTCQIVEAGYTMLSSDYHVESQPDGSLKIASPRTLTKFLKQQYDKKGDPVGFLKWVGDKGRPVDLTYIYLHPFWLVGPDSNTLLERAKSN